MWADDDALDSFEWEFGEQSVVIGFTRDRRKHTQEIALTFTPCRFGGRRTWFLCPSCGRRVGKVYLPCSMYYGGQRVACFRCRFCYGLTYEQRRDRDRYWTFQHRIERIEARWLGEISKDWISKRKGQHWRTFNRWFEKREALIEKSDQAFLGGMMGVISVDGTANFCHFSQSFWNPICLPLRSIIRILLRL